MAPAVLLAGVSASAITAHLMGGVIPPTYAWYTVWEQGGGQAALSGFADHTFRARIPATTIGEYVGAKIRVTFRAGGDAMTIPNAFIGKKAPTGDPWDFASAPTRLKFGGSNSVTIPAGTDQVSDETLFDLNADDDLIISFHNETSNQPYFMWPSLSKGVVGWYNQGHTDDAATVDASGYRVTEVYYAPLGVVKLEVLGISDPYIPPPEFPINAGLINGGAELGDASGWTQLTGSPPQYRASNADGFASQAGAGYFRLSVDQAVAKWAQVIDLTALADWDAIASALSTGRVRATFTSYVRCVGNDRGAPFIETLDDLGHVIDSRYLGENPYNTAAVWTKLDLNVLLTPAIHSIRVGQKGTRVDGVTLDYFIDSMALSINIVAPQAYDSYGDFVVFHLYADDGVRSDASLAPMPINPEANVTTGGGGDNKYLTPASILNLYNIYIPESTVASLYLDDGDYTIEGFITWPINTLSAMLFTIKGNASFYGRQSFRLDIQNGYYEWRTWGGTLLDLTSSIRVVPNVEHHLAIVRKGNTVTMYMDGVVADQDVFAGAVQHGFTYDNLLIWAFAAQAGARLDDWRLTKLARYDGAFTPQKPLLKPKPSPKGENEHYWWRVRYTGIQGFGSGGGANRAVLRRALFLENPSAPRVALGAVLATMSSPNASGTATGAFTTSDLTAGAPNYWDSADATSMFLARKFVPARDFCGVGLLSKGDASKFAPSGFVLEWSDDEGSSWTPKITVPVAGAWSDTWDQYKVFFSTDVDYVGSPWGQHEYWRAYVIEGASNSLRAAEIEWRATPGGADQAEGSGGAGSQSNQWSGQAPALAYDSNPATYCETVSDTAYVDWVGYHFPAAVALAEIGWMSQDSTHNPRNGWAFYSDDNINYYPAFGWIRNTWTAGGQMITLKDPVYGPPAAPPAGSHGAWRVLISQNNGGAYSGVGSKLAMYASNDGTGTELVSDVGGLVIASSGGVFGNVPGNLVDNDDSTQWLATETGADWAGFIFNQPVNIGSIKMKASTAGGQEPLMAMDFAIQWSDDGGATWTTKWSEAGVNWLAGASERVFAP